MKVLGPCFFDRAADKVAVDLIGCRLCWKHDGHSDSRIITETEAYLGPHDLASHAAKGRTKRTEIMFGEAGTLYVYFVYGMHWMLNVVTGPVGYPAAVLIRAVQGINGPARLTKAIGVTGSINGKQADEENGVWFSEETRPLRTKIIRSARIGVDYAGPVWAAKPHRFTLSG
jgi:DNA-3-methyladenine glycosylase